MRFSFLLLTTLILSQLTQAAEEATSEEEAPPTVEILVERDLDKDKAETNPLCFDFAKKKYTEPLRPAPPLKEGGRDVYQQGSRPAYDWASGHGIVPRTVKQMYEWLLDHTNWKDMTKTKMKVTVGKRPNYMAFHEVTVDVRVFAFITVGWTEQWAYALLEGTEEKPTKILVSYQKTEGTSHLESLCGSVLVTKFDDFDSDVYFYEQAKASRYKAENILPMHIATMKILKKPYVAPTPSPTPEK